MANSVRTIIASSSKLLLRSSSIPSISKPSSFSTSATFNSPLPPTLPHHTHPSSRTPTPFPQTESSPTPLELLSSQPNHYVSVLLLGRRYLLTQDDVLTVPKLKNLPIGTKIALTRILEVGSRDYTLRASVPTTPTSTTQIETEALPQTQPTLISHLTLSTSALHPTIPRDFQRFPNSLPYLPSSTVQASATIIEHTKGKMFEVEKFKKRKGYRRLLRFKLGFTKLRIGKIVIGDGQTVVEGIKDEELVVETA